MSWLVLNLASIRIKLPGSEISLISAIKIRVKLSIESTTFVSKCDHQDISFYCFQKTVIRTKQYVHLQEGRNYQKINKDHYVYGTKTIIFGTDSFLCQKEKIGYYYFVTFCSLCNEAVGNFIQTSVMLLFTTQNQCISIYVTICVHIAAPRDRHQGGTVGPGQIGGIE